ncbi:MAG: hypothetical protein WBG70_18155 [Spirulinaceae cyanobacterium]
MRNLYELVLGGLFTTVGIDVKDRSKQNKRKAVKYLKSLKQPLKELRASYKSNIVMTNYSSEEVQAAYLLGYYPHYAYMNLQVLEKLEKDYLPFENSEVKACFFGSGPTTEAVGLATYS